MQTVQHSRSQGPAIAAGRTAAKGESFVIAKAGKPDFHVDPHLFRRALLDNGYIELLITSEHAAGVANLPDHHRDPFDRLLVSQATVEGITLLTNDELVAAYTTSPVRLV